MIIEFLNKNYCHWLLLVVTSCIIILLLAYWGAVFLSIFTKLRLTNKQLPSFCENILIGFLAFSFVGYLGILAQYSLKFTLAMFLLVSVLGHLFTICFKPIGAFRLTSLNIFWDSTSLATITTLVLGSLVWSVNNFKGLSNGPTGDLLLAPWVDIFYHARIIGIFAQFTGDPASLHYSMAGEPMPIYHYGSYIVPAIIASLSGISSLQIATSIFPVFGMALTGASMVVLASLLTDKLGILLALFILFFVPDPSFWIPGDWIQSTWPRWYSYFFFQQVGIGGTYAVSVMGLALAFMLKAVKTQSTWLAFISLVVFVLTAFFKATFVLAYCLIFTIFVCWNVHWKSKILRLSFFLASFLLFLIVINYSNKIPYSPSFFISIDGAKENINKLVEIFSVRQSSVFYWLYAPLLSIFVLSILTYGLLFLGSVVLVLAMAKLESNRLVIGLLSTIYLGHLFIALLIANNQGYGDPYEVNHKSFVWPYFVISLCFSVLLRSFYLTYAAPSFQKNIFISGIGLGFGFFTLTSASDVQTKNSLPDLINRPIDRGLFVSAIYIQNHSLSGEVVQLCENDKLNQLGTISERPVYIVNIVINSPGLNYKQAARFKKLDAILQSDTLASAKNLLADANISWWLMTPNCHAPWENQTQPILSSNGYRLYKPLTF